MNTTEATRHTSSSADPGDIRFSRLGLGTGMLASWRGGLSLADADRLIAAASDHGLQLIDTADSYASGECERLLGRLLQGRRNAFQLMTKAGYATADLPGPLHRLNPIAKKVLHRFGQPQNFDPGYLKKALEKSLRRLRCESVDVFLLHDPPSASLANGKVFETLDAIRQLGMAKMVGVSSGEEDTLVLALKWPGCEVIQTPLVAEGGLAKALLTPSAAGMKIILNHVSLGSRLPGDGQDPDQRIQSLQTKIANHATEHGIGKHAALLAIALETTGATSVLTGTRCVDHLRENAKAVMGK